MPIPRPTLNITITYPGTEASTSHASPNLSKLILSTYNEPIGIAFMVLFILSILIAATRAVISAILREEERRDHMARSGGVVVLAERSDVNYGTVEAGDTGRWGWDENGRWKGGDILKKSQQQQQQKQKQKSKKQVRFAQVQEREREAHAEERVVQIHESEIQVHDRRVERPLIEEMIGPSEQSEPTDGWKGSVGRWW